MAADNGTGLKVIEETMNREIEVVTCCTCAKQISDGEYIEPEHLEGGQFQCYQCVQEAFERWNAERAAAAEQRKAVVAFDAELKRQRLILLERYLN